MPLRHTTKHLFRFGVLLLLTALAACQPTKVDPGYEALVEQEHAIPAVGELGAGDKFQLHVYGEGQLSGEFTVSSEGTFNYPYLGRIEAEGKTCADLEDELTKGLADGYLKQPNVRCSITEYNSKRIFIFGEVGSPGSFPYRSNITIIEAMALAGGFGDRADTNRTKLSRVIKGTEVQVRVPVQEIVEGRSQNIKLLPGDIVYVPQAAY
jgi:polysaccharide export outer membrane protein